MKYFKTSTVLVFFISILFSFFLGRYSASFNSLDLSNEIATTGILAENEGDTISNQSTVADAIEEKEEDTLQIAQVEKEPEEAVKKIESNTVEKEKEKENTNNTTTIGIASSELARISTGISDKKISEVLSKVAQNLEDKKLSYTPSLMQDCSGIFHQMKDSLQSRLPSLAANKKIFQYPSPKKVRNSRQIADWYYKNKNLLLVEDAMASRNSIRPGSVLFYGKSNKKFKNITIEMLTDRDNNYTSNGAIMHIAVVTAVTTDEEGNVIDYTIMHGRNPKRTASRTGSKAVQSTRKPNLPPFGNWSQQLVAIANIVTPSQG